MSTTSVPAKGTVNGSLCCDVGFVVLQMPVVTATCDGSGGKAVATYCLLTGFGFGGAARAGASEPTATTAVREAARAVRVRMAPTSRRT
jgi:hypothetical protein